MNEKIYKTMSASGISSIVIGIIIAAVGIGCGAVSIIFGGHLLKKRKQIVF
jgi:hypothetical protein